MLPWGGGQLPKSGRSLRGVGAMQALGDHLSGLAAVAAPSWSRSKEYIVVCTGWGRASSCARQVIFLESVVNWNGRPGSFDLVRRPAEKRRLLLEADGHPVRRSASVVPQATQESGPIPRGPSA